ncbi:TetR/AcrR family transcriptional regulator [Thiomonas sp. FB-Cd]|uniref:TetR/AcrR family transcriptional regulator n=1 Tax=Thiomonas sp. FB-Cd TaxID=1158292 RepID=UPI00068F972F|nr:TetR/AcrR family transcriptional regulator [Thiomonas sp. FB-Cd]
MSPASLQSASASGSRPVGARGGRPSREASEQFRERILDAATGLLLTSGYGATSIEAVASAAGVSKRTFYHRFDDKKALMSAVVARLIDSARPPTHVPLIDGSGLEQILENLARLILRGALNPNILALYRLIVAESARFPDLAAAVAQAGGREEAMHLIVKLLMNDAELRELGVASATFAAEQFLQMVVSLPQMRAIGLGTPMSQDDLETWVRRSVALFIGGLKHLETSPETASD